MKRSREPAPVTPTSPQAGAALAVQQALWVGRRFDHQLEIDLLPSVLERLRGTPLRVRSLMSSASPAEHVARPDGRWSLQEHVGHLIDLEELGEQRLADYRAGATTLTAADMSNRKTHEARYNESVLTAMLARFDQTRQHLVEMIEQLPGAILAHRATHPRLQRLMNVVEWVYFVCEHDDHHLARMREQIRALRAHAAAGHAPG